MKIVKRTCRTETHKDELIEYHFVTLSYETEFEVTLKAINFAIEKKKHFTGIWFRDFSINENQKSHWISIFLLLIVIKHVTETLISLQQVEICNVLVSISYFTQIFGKREPQTW